MELLSTFNKFHMIRASYFSNATKALAILPVDFSVTIVQTRFAIEPFVYFFSISLPAVPTPAFSISSLR